MKLRVLLFIFYLLEKIIKVMKIYFINKQRQKKLPKEVSDIYDAEHYQEFLNYKHDYHKVTYTSCLIDLLFEGFVLFTDFYIWIEKMANDHVYLIIIYTLIINFIISSIFKFIFQYYETFYIEEKYKLNKMSIQDFIKYYMRESVFNFLIIILISFFIGFICENIADWTNHFSNHMIVITITIDSCFAIIMLITALLSLFNLKMQYHFEEMPHCQTRTDIENILSGCKKRIHRITIYNESKKSVEKNAFLLNLGFYREISIADNFMNENSHNELLAVLSHEVGHLKHKKNIFNIINYIVVLVLIIFINTLIIYPQFLIVCNQYINQSFRIHCTNYYLSIEIFSFIIVKCLHIYQIFTNYISRSEEYEADRYAMELGYGEELIKTFKKVSHDEFIDVNPAPIIEILEYDHPGMYNRINAIYNEMK